MSKQLFWGIVANVAIWPAVGLATIDSMRNITLNEWGIFFMHPWYYGISTGIALFGMWKAGWRG